jgi:hypothetical protein
LLHGRQPVAHRSVANLDLRKIAQLSINVVVQLGRRLLLNSQKILLVEDLGALEQ